MTRNTASSSYAATAKLTPSAASIVGTSTCQRTVAGHALGTAIVGVWGPGAVAVVALFQRGRRARRLQK